jgi:hypothetical protein
MTVINVKDATLKGSVKGPTFTGNVDGATFTGDVTYTETSPPIEPPIEPPPTNTHGKIENFTTAAGREYKIDTLSCANDTPANAWNITKVDDYTLRFEIRQGDRYSDGSNRAEVSFWQRYNEGAVLNWEATVTLLAGPVNTAGFCSLVQAHAVANNPPAPFYLNVDKGDYLAAIIQNPSTPWKNIYKSPQPLVRGKAYGMRAQVMMKPNGGGYAKVWLDGAQVANYNGAIGANNSQYWWKYGIYRDSVAETAKAEFKNVHITTG